MEIKLVKWSEDLKGDLIDLCNKADRSFLSERTVCSVPLL